MPKFRVHLYREIRFVIEDIEADTPLEAVRLAEPMADMVQADAYDDCEGLFHSALVDEEGDAEYEKSLTFDYKDGVLQEGGEPHSRRPVDRIYDPKSTRRDAKGNIIPWAKEHDYFMGFDPENPDVPTD